MEGWLDLRQAAACIGCDSSRLRQLILDGTMRGIKFKDKFWLVSPEEVERIKRWKPTTGRPRNGNPSEEIDDKGDDNG